MATQTPRKDSQFSGAAAMFRKKEMDLISSTTNASFSPMRTKGTKGVGRNASDKYSKSTTTLNSFPFVSTGHRKSTDDLRKNGENTSWKNSGTMLQSPPSKKNAIFSPMRTPPSYMSKQNRTQPSKKPNSSNVAVTGYGGAISFSNYDTEPDIKIQVKSDIQQKIKARQRSHGSQHVKQSRPSSSSQNICDDTPEHVRKFRAREERRIRAQEERDYRSASLVQAAFLGWYARVQYPALLAANAGKLRQRRQREIQKRKIDMAILTIQKTFRMYLPRKRYRYVMECKRRRERNLKEIKKIKKTIEKMPKKTKQEIKEKKQEYGLMKKEMKRTSRKIVKEEEEHFLKLQKSGQDMMKYLQDENNKVRTRMQTIQKEQTVLEKQFELLTAKSEEIACNFKSLQEWVGTKNVAIQKNEASDQKCRYRYLPKYRKDLVIRNIYCITEFRIKELYKRQSKRIIKEVEAKSTDPSLVKLVKKEIKACRKSVNERPENPIPEGLEHRLKMR